MDKLTPTEKAIQDGVIANLNLVGFDFADRRHPLPPSSRGRGVAWRQNVGTAVAKDEFGRTTRSVDFGFKGQADLLLIFPGGRFGSIEFKNANGKLRPEQLVYRDACISIGSFYELGRSTPYVLRMIRDEVIRLGYSSLIQRDPLERLLRAAA